MFTHSLRRVLPQLFVFITIVTIFAFAVAPARAESRTYVVQTGDTLFGIAARFNVSLSELATIKKIYDVKAIYVGQVLILPNPLPAGFQSGNASTGSQADGSGSQFGTGGATGGGGTSSGSVSPSGFVSYVVRPGDTLSAI